MTTPGRRQTTEQRNTYHRAAITGPGTDRLLAKSTIAQDIENLSKVQNSRPLKPPMRKRASNG